MTPELLKQAGTALYPWDWTVGLAHDLHLNHRRLRRMAKGDEDIPKGIWPDLLALMQQRRGRIITAENRLLMAMKGAGQ